MTTKNLTSGLSLMLSTLLCFCTPSEESSASQDATKDSFTITGDWEKDLTADPDFKNGTQSEQCPKPKVKSVKFIKFRDMPSEDRDRNRETLDKLGDEIGQDSTVALLTVDPVDGPNNNAENVTRTQIYWSVCTITNGQKLLQGGIPFDPTDVDGAGPIKYNTKDREFYILNSKGTSGNLISLSPSSEHPLRLAAVNFCGSSSTNGSTRSPVVSSEHFPSN